MFAPRVNVELLRSKFSNLTEPSVVPSSCSETIEESNSDEEESADNSYSKLESELTVKTDSDDV